MAARKKALKRDVLAFQKRMDQVLKDAGATKFSGERKQWGVETKAGPLGITVYEDWVATQFEDPNRAVKALGKNAGVNEFTGKWNHHYGSDVSAESAEYFERQLKAILVNHPEKNPCGCSKANPPSSTEGMNLKQRYRHFEVQAQRNAAKGKPNVAKIYKRQAEDTLKQARSAGEPWSNPVARANPWGDLTFTFASGVESKAARVAADQLPNGAVTTRYTTGSGLTLAFKNKDFLQQFTEHLFSVDSPKVRMKAQTIWNEHLIGRVGRSNPVIDPPEVTPGDLVKVLFPSGNWGVYRATKAKPETTMEMVKVWDHVASTSLMPKGNRKWFMNDYGTFRAASKAMAAKFDAMPVHGSYKSKIQGKERPTANPCGCGQNPSHETEAQKKAKRHLYRGHGEKDLEEFDWVVISSLLDGGVVNIRNVEVMGENRPGEIEIKLYKGKHKGKRIFITDNGGELNLDVVAKGSTPTNPKRTPLIDFSIPYTSNKFVIGDQTLAYRIEMALRGEQIDYDINVDKMGAAS